MFYYGSYVQDAVIGTGTGRPSKSYLALKSNVAGFVQQNVQITFLFSVTAGKEKIHSARPVT